MSLWTSNDLGINSILPRVGLDPEHEPDLTKILGAPEAWEEMRTKVKEVLL